ncbi:MAG: hypothetical protein ABH828_02750 [archaeon]
MMNKKGEGIGGFTLFSPGKMFILIAVILATIILFILPTIKKVLGSLFG